jgi:hypothetical protein
MRNAMTGWRLRLALGGAVCLAGGPSSAANEPVAVVGAFVMTEAEDGKQSSDSFEVWDILCYLKEPFPAGRRSCSITAVSFVQSSGETRLFTWRHDSTDVREVASGVFRAQLNGRLSDCSGLDVVIRLDAAVPTGVEAIEGDMRSGSRCQSRRRFTLDTTSRSRAIAPLRNSSHRSSR